MTIYRITPVAKPRMTRRDSAASLQNRIRGMRPAVAKYFDFVKLCQIYRVELPVGAKVIFHIPMPESWSNAKKARMNLTPHTTRPDLSNLIKELEDACYAEDSTIWEYTGLVKRWDYTGKIIIYRKGEAEKCST